jgi:uncharacterized membrane protein YqaE (UPF0057 family)
MSGGRIAAALLLPPLAVFLARGGGRDFAIGSVLTVLAFVPGVIFALWTLASARTASSMPR